MIARTVALTLGLTFGAAAHAATWYAFSTISSNDTTYFFDLDTMTKKAGAVTIWVKYINADNAPDPDGSYATALKTVYVCPSRTAQVTTSVTYDKKQNMIRTNDTPSKASEVVPGSVGESIFKTVCAPDFPNAKTASYTRIPDNDIYAAARRMVAPDPAPH